MTAARTEKCMHSRQPCTSLVATYTAPLPCRLAVKKAYQLQGMCVQGALVSRLEQLLVEAPPLQVGPSGDGVSVHL